MEVIFTEPKAIVAIIFAIIIFVLALLSLILAFVSYFLSFYTRRRTHYDVYHGLTDEEIEGNPRKQLSRSYVDELMALPYESVSVRSRDGLTLRAKYYEIKKGAPLEIQFHGYRSTSRHDFSGGTLESMRRGHNVLLVDQRSHGESDGRTISFGVKERYDVLAWVDFANERFGEDVQIILVGISMGAGTVIMSSELDLPSNVAAIVADCPYSSPVEIISKVIREDLHLPAALLIPFVRLGGMLFGGFDMLSASPVEAVKNTEIPILILHGEGDNFVPCYMSEKIAAAGKTVTLVTFAEAGHGLSFIYDGEKYKRALDEFYGKNL